jgi:SAM-dependent methyltransferase
MGIPVRQRRQPEVIATMIIHKLIAHHLRARDDDSFYNLQAEDAVAWILANGVVLRPGTRVLDLGCGHGILGATIQKFGGTITYADAGNYLHPSLKNAPFINFDLDREDIARLGTYDLVICSNVFEHLSKPDQFIAQVDRIINPGGWLYLTWTNWLSPWGGHEFSPFHYFGAKYGHRIYDKIIGKKRNHTPYENLFPTYIGQTVRQIRTQPNLEVIKVVPRYYTEFGFLMKIPLVREFVAWNCAVLAKRK